MFGIDEFALWFSWYLVTGIAQHPSAQRLYEQAETALVDPYRPYQVGDPHKMLDWLDIPGPKQPPLAGVAAPPPLPAVPRAGSTD